VFTSATNVSSVAERVAGAAPAAPSVIVELVAASEVAVQAFVAAAGAFVVAGWLLVIVVFGFVAFIVPYRPVPGGTDCVKKTTGKLRESTKAMAVRRVKQESLIE
jgi:hypothetical protein